MKLAEALARRADVQRRIEGMRGRLSAGALVQEGEEPPSTRTSCWWKRRSCCGSWKASSRASTG